MRLSKLRAAYQRILDHPFGYQELRSGIRRALTRRFPYAIYYEVEDGTAFVYAILDLRRDPVWTRDQLAKRD